MNETDIVEKQKYIFSRLFLLSNKLMILGDQVLSDEMTIKQWLLTVAIAQYRGNPPTLSQVSQLLGCSHQNAKQLALKLQEGGYLSIERDKKDLRTTRFRLTEKSFAFWEKRQEEIRRFLMRLLEDFSEEEIDILQNCLNKLYASILKIESAL